MAEREEYTIHLVRTGQGWQGTLSGTAETRHFSGLEQLWKMLGGPAVPVGDLERMRQMLMTDALTGALSRRGLEDRARALLAKTGGRGVGLLFLDIDDLKAINDRWGHMAGDRVLCSAAQAVSLLLEPEDLLGRVGGDEFVVLLQGVAGAEDLSERAQALCRAVSSYGPDTGLSVSIGGAVAPSGRPTTYRDLLQQADEAMYQVKRTGKNGHIISRES